MDSAVNDEVLMSRFQAGDREAFSALVRRYQGPLYNFVFRTLRSKEGAEDVVQDAFVRVVQNAQEFQFSSKFSTWLFTIARNLCIDQIRKASVRKSVSLDQRKGGEEDGPVLGEQLGDPNARTEAVSEDAELRTQLEQAIGQLPEDQREVFLLREVSELPFKEIAIITGVSENTVKSRMRYALERLQEALETLRSLHQHS